MYCSNCGKEVSEEERFCSGCGKALKETNEEKKKPLTNNMLIVGLCCVFAVLVVGIFAAGISFGKKDVPADGTTTSETTTEKEEEATTTTKATTTVKASQVTTKKAQSVTASASKNLPTDSKGIVKPDAAIMGARYYVYPSDGLYLRTGPGTNYSEIMLLSQGTAVSEEGYRDDSPGWMLVRLMNGSTYGWVSKEYLSLNNPGNKSMNEIYEYEKPVSTIVLAEDGLNLRSLPSESGRVLGTIPYKRSISVIGYSAYDLEWIYVSVYLDGRTQYGFVNERYVQH